MSLELDADMNQPLPRYQDDVLSGWSKISASLDELDDLILATNTETRFKCVCCQESFPKRQIVEFECYNRYCKECLILLVKKSLHDESLFPPRCCTHRISITAVKETIGPILVQKYAQRLVEFQDPDKTYCSEPTCSRYIPPKQINGKNTMVCRCKCGRRTCRKCKQKAHGELDDCVRHFDGLLEDLAKCQGWKRCLECYRMIELNKGCYHIR